MVAFKTHNLEYDCEKRMVIVMVRMTLPEEIDDFGDVKCSHE